MDRAALIAVGLDTAFLHGLGRSLLLAAAVAGVSLAIGWPLGVRVGLTRFPLRRVLLTLLALPLLLPSFLVAIGLSMLTPRFDGGLATVGAFACLGVPLVTFASLAATMAITRSQADAARLAGGERLLFALGRRTTFPLAGLAAVLAGVMTLADPGPGQIFGWRGAASELLVSFAAQHDASLAARQAWTMALVSALLAWPLAWRLAPEVAAGLSARDVARPELSHSPVSAWWLAGVASLVALVPLAGLLRPLLARAWPIARAWSEVERTAVDTVLYASLAAGIAVAVAFALAAIAGRAPGRRRGLVACALALLALPPALPALWLIPWSSSVAVGAALALRGLPIALLLALRAVGSMPASWSEAAHVHGVSNIQFIAQIAVPWCARWGLPAAALAAMLATAEIGTVLLLHPPGRGTLPLAIFTIMANAPETLVAMLCLVYTVLVAALAIAVQVPAHQR